MSKSAAKPVTADSTVIEASKRDYRGSNWCRADKRLAVYLRDGMSCVYCGTGPATSESATLSLDHLLPNSKGGGNHEGNLVTCCGRCNSRRGNMDLGPWLTMACGDSAAKIAALITEHTAKDLTPFRAEAKAIIARRIAA